MNIFLGILGGITGLCIGYFKLDRKLWNWTKSKFN